MKNAAGWMGMCALGVGLTLAGALAYNVGREAPASTTRPARVPPAGDLTHTAQRNETAPPLADGRSSASGPHHTAREADSHREKARARASAIYDQLPLAFEANRGQAAPEVSFISRGAGYALLLSSGQATLALGHSPQPGAAKGPADHAPATARVTMTIAGADAGARSQGVGPLSGRSHYFVGDDASRWVQDVATYESVLYRDVYPGIDLTYYGRQRQLEYDFIVAPGHSPQDIALEFSGVDALHVDDAGNLILSTLAGDLTQHKPVIYQERDGVREPVDGGYRVDAAHQVRFWVGAFDTGRSLVIDPVLTYATFLGGSGVDSAQSVAVDSAGNAYVVGSTASTDYPLAGPLQAIQQGNFDVVIVKVNAAGTAIDYATYLGGSANDSGIGIAVDTLGEVMVTGSTGSTDFPTVSPIQASNGGQFDVFVAKVNAQGSALLYSTYLGGSQDDFGFGIVTDGSGSAYLTGTTSSANFPTASAAQGTTGGNFDGFVTKVSADGSTLAYSTYLGGSDSDSALGIAVDGSGAAYVTGTTGSTDFPLATPFRSTYAGGFVTKLNAAGTALAYSSYLGAAGSDSGYGIAVDASGSAYVVGTTASASYQTLTPFQATSGGGLDGFVQKIGPSGSTVTYASYLGGAGTDIAINIAVDGSGHAYVTGYTNSTNFPVASAVQSANAGGYDAFVTKIGASGASLDYSTYVGGSQHDFGAAIAATSAGTVVMVGNTASANFPATGAIQPSLSGAGDGFLIRIATYALTVTSSGTGGGTVTTSQTGVACGTDCNSFDGAVTVRLTAVPDADSDFAGWNGDSRCSTESVPVDGVINCSARFVRQSAASPIYLNADRRGDAFVFHRTSGLWAEALADGAGGFSYPPLGTWSPNWMIRAGDFNGDALTDLFLYDWTEGTWFRAINNGQGGFTYQQGHWSAGWSIYVVDLNGDGRSDVFVYDPRTGLWFRCLTQGAADFAYTSGAWSPSWEVYPAEFTGDRYPDFFLYNSTSGVWFKAINTGTSFTYVSGVWSGGWHITTGDFGGDGRTDVFAYHPTTGQWTLATHLASGGFSFTSGVWSAGWRIYPAKLDTDRLSDLFLYDPSSGLWFEAFNNGNGTFRYVGGTWSPGWSVVVTDLNADSRSDLFLYNVDTGLWFQSLNAYPGTFAYAGGVWDPAWTIIANQFVVP